MTKTEKKRGTPGISLPTPVRPGTTLPRSNLTVRTFPATITQDSPMRQLRFLRPRSLALLFIFGCAALRAQQSPPPKESPAPAPMERLTIAVTGGDANVPVE